MSTQLAVLAPSDIARVEQLAALQITSPAQEKDAVDGLAFVQGLLRALKKEHKEQRDPLKASLDKLDESWKAIIGQVETGEKNVKTAILHWRQAESARVQGEQLRIARENAERLRLAQEAEEAEKKRVAEAAAEEARAAGFTEPDVQAYAASEVKDAPVVPAPLLEVAPAAPANTVRATLGSATVRKKWNYRIVDAALVPHAYRTCEPSAGAIRAAMNAGVRELPGCEFFEEDELAGRRIA